MYKVVLVRHGESLWNQENRFTGWTDVDLTEKGVQEAIKAGELLKQVPYEIDVAFTSVLKRAIKTLHHILDVNDLLWIPIYKHWKLNERHYGALQGLNKQETADKYGAEQVKIWRRSYDVPPLQITADDERYPQKDKRYGQLTEQEIPLGESLKDTIARVVPYWEAEIVPQIKAGKKVLVVAHGNSLRALMKVLENISDEDIIDLNIPTAVPIMYELDENMTPLRREFLGDRKGVQEKIDVVANPSKIME
ncbi:MULTISPECIES: 2,3-diphosphoglycerate-dependent phosphoglycerate mutase [Paenibacillus]|uniref:2,3-bisphosphoglycerate-dependent phosphoglycerate mutase n=1 Tax=Paenibacillus azoreducens TaxID=116718 RepID=A0A919YCG7_9BACL|nr:MULTISPECIES: 2,3-diphosphoglycerate-dependent phosphoglycerate mutase [Paenibacillus]MBE9916045.1 2,3-diphosphoglycerate-dependent phosphoglycerate mutase [Paenibacillus donghaensis]GIO46653.1 2,3-bisphosphoglycerate-dependent phosphoglycerate mutase [Paenibacillus azoreducens]